MGKLNIQYSNWYKYVHLITYTISWMDLWEVYTISVYTNEPYPSLTEINNELDDFWNNYYNTSEYKIYQEWEISISSCVTTLNK